MRGRSAGSTAPAPLEGFRERFPSLADAVHLASCSQGALSEDLTAALRDLQQSLRDVGVPWHVWLQEAERLRASFADMINARPDEIAMLSCASAGAFQAASTRDWSRRPRIVTSDMEFPSVSHVWLAQRARGAEVVHAPVRGATVHAEDYVAHIDERTGLVSVPLVSYRNGVRMPVDHVIAAAKEHGVTTFVDGYQACGVLPVDVQALGCDFFVTGTQKYLLGLPGLAFLYVRDGVTDDCPPQLTGWFGRGNPFAFDPHVLDFPDSARRFEVGTPPVPSIYAARAGLGLLAELPMQAVAAHVGDLASSLCGRLADIGERLWHPAHEEPGGPMVALRDQDPESLAAFLTARGIVTAPRGGVLRLSFHAYNDTSDVDSVYDAIVAYREELARTPMWFHPDHGNP